LATPFAIASASLEISRWRADKLLLESLSVCEIDCRPGAAVAELSPRPSLLKIGIFPALGGDYRRFDRLQARNGKLGTHDERAKARPLVAAPSNLSEHRNGWPGRKAQRYRSVDRLGRSVSLLVEREGFETTWPKAHGRPWIWALYRLGTV